MLPLARMLTSALTMQVNRLAILLERIQPHSTLILRMHWGTLWVKQVQKESVTIVSDVVSFAKKADNPPYKRWE